MPSQNDETNRYSYGNMLHHGTITHTGFVEREDKQPWDPNEIQLTKEL